MSSIDELKVATWVIYTKEHCPYCDYAKDIMGSLQLPFKAILVNDIDKKEELSKKSGMKTFPQIFVNKKLVGGFTDLFNYLEDFS